MNPLRISVSRSALAVVALVALLLPSLAAGGTLSRSNDDGHAVAGVDRAFGVPVYWTPERMRDALATTPPLDPVSVLDEPAAASTEEASESGPAGRPLPGVRADPQWLFDPTGARGAAEDAASVDVSVPAARGTAQFHYSSSRIIPTSGDRVYPYRAVGKLFYTKPGEGNYVCSAAVLRPRVILTAGHCVHSGRNGSDGFFRNFMFVPAYRNGTAPYRTWDWQWVVTTTAWSRGGGGVPNPGDYAIIELKDQSVGGHSRRVGDLTGWFGWKTNATHPNHTHALGYPVNLDGGQRMHQVTAQSQGNFSSNTVRYGSDMRGGSSGGPFVQNFGKRAAGQNKGVNRGTNQIVGVVSSVPSKTGVLYSSTSRLDSQFKEIYDRACAHRSGNCGS